MKLKYTGTAAAEAIPALFCECPVCEKARAALGKDLRCRSGMVIDDTLMVDLPPDIYFSSIRQGLYLPGIRDILITHTHADHMDAEELLYRDSRVFCTKKANAPLGLYGNGQAGKKLESVLAEYFRKDLPDVVYRQVHGLTPFAVQDYTVTPLPANHKPDEEAFIYMIEKDGKALLYGNDTGVLPEITKEYIEKTKPYFRAVNLDATMGFMRIPHSHMGFAQIAGIRAWLREIGCADENTVFVATHFSHNGLLKDGVPYLHADLVSLPELDGFTVAYDGMELEI